VLKKYKNMQKNTIDEQAELEMEALKMAQRNHDGYYDHHAEILAERVRMDNQGSL